MSGVTGQARLREVQARLYSTPEALTKEDTAALRRAAVKVPPIIRAEVPSHVPRGYEPVLAKALEFETSVRQKIGMLITISASGKVERRDLPAINRGTLRHPLFGNRSHWYAQRRGVKAGLVEDGIRKAQPMIIKEVQKARDKTADHILGR